MFKGCAGWNRISASSYVIVATYALLDLPKDWLSWLRDQQFRRSPDATDLVDRIKSPAAKKDTLSRKSLSSTTNPKNDRPKRQKATTANT